MVSTPTPNGFADHYPYEKWLFHWEYTQHFQTNPYEHWEHWENPWFPVQIFPTQPIKNEWMDVKSSPKIW